MLLLLLQLDRAPCPNENDTLSWFLSDRGSVNKIHSTEIEFCARNFASSPIPLVARSFLHLYSITEENIDHEDVAQSEDQQGDNRDHESLHEILELIVKEPQPR